VIGIGIVGCNYGRTVLIPAFRGDPRCEVVALAGTDSARTVRLARASNVARGFGDWRALVEEPAVAVVAIAVPPSISSPPSRSAPSRSENRSSSKSPSLPISQERGLFSSRRARARNPPLSN
jgi:hypothetical protein